MTAIILGAMAAHLLKGSLFPAELDTFKLAVRYQFWMGFSILMMVIIENVFLPSPRMIAVITKRLATTSKRFDCGFTR